MFGLKSDFGFSIDKALEAFENKTIHIYTLAMRNMYQTLTLFSSRSKCLFIFCESTKNGILYEVL